MNQSHHSQDRSYTNHAFNDQSYKNRSGGSMSRHYKPMPNDSYTKEDFYRNRTSRGGSMTFEDSNMESAVEYRSAPPVRG